MLQQVERIWARAGNWYETLAIGFNLEAPKHKVRVLLTQLWRLVLFFMLHSLFCFLPVGWNAFQWKSLYWILHKHIGIVQAPFSYIISLLCVIINCCCSSLKYALLSIYITLLTMLGCAMAHAVVCRPLTIKAQTRWHWDRLLSECFIFSLSVSFHQCHTHSFIYHQST